jgi:hypothetical protein
MVGKRRASRANHDRQEKEELPRRDWRVGFGG